jgi:hypothetical protein
MRFHFQQLTEPIFALLDEVTVHLVHHHLLSQSKSSATRSQRLHGLLAYWGLPCASR